MLSSGTLVSFYRRHEKTVQAVLALAVFIMAFFMYRYVEFSSDDLIYMNKWHSTEHLETLNDIIYYEQQYYLTWGSRVITQFFLQVMFLLPRPLSALCYALVFTGSAWMVSRIAGQGKDSGLLFLLSAGLMYYLNPKFDETITWYTGAATYMLALLFVLSASAPFIRKALAPDSKINGLTWLLLPVSFMAGWSIENMAPTMLLFMGYVIFTMLRNKEKVHPYYFCALACAALGTGGMLLAPGNGARGSSFAGGLMTIAYRGHGQVNAWCTWLFPAMAVFAVLRYINYRRNRTDMPGGEKALLAWYAVSVLIMVAAPTFPQRAAYGPFMILLICILREYQELMHSDQKTGDFMSLLALIVCVAFIGVLLSVDVLSFVRAMGAQIPH